MKNISLVKLRTLAAAVADAEQGSKAWDKATDALNSKFSPRCLVNLIDQLEAAQRDRDVLRDQRQMWVDHCKTACDEMDRRDAQEPVGMFMRTVEVEPVPGRIGYSHMKGDDAKSAHCFPLYAAAPAAVLPPQITPDEARRFGNPHGLNGYQLLADVYNQALTDARALGCKAAVRLGVPDDWKMVPIEPTEQMMLNESDCQRHAWNDNDCSARQTRRFIWQHMVEAAPAPGGSNE